MNNARRMSIGLKSMVWLFLALVSRIRIFKRYPKLVETLKRKSETRLYIIKKCYGHETRPAVILFRNNTPEKGYCSCPVGSFKVL